MAGQKKIKLLAVVGSTASGKSALAVELAKRLGGEVVSCDSMQIYRGMDIGTAKPTPAETDGIAHHLIDCADADKPFSAADYVAAASEVIAEINARGVLPILCGGTGLYLDGLLRGGYEEMTATVPGVREELFAFAEAHGNHALHERLAAVDPESAAAIHENNVKRVVRALEIFETTGETKSSFDRRSQEVESPYEACVIGLRYCDRTVLYRRIEARVEAMLAAGLIEETKRLSAAGVFEKNSTAAQAIGYKELLPYLEGRESLESAVDALKTATRRYAKRQITWFGAKDYVRWIEMTSADALRPLSEIADEAVAIFENR